MGDNRGLSVGTLTTSIGLLSVKGIRQFCLKACSCSELTLRQRLKIKNGTEQVEKENSCVLLEAATQPSKRLGMKCNIPRIALIQTNI